MNTQKLSTAELLDHINQIHSHVLICDAIGREHTGAERTLEILGEDFVDRVRASEGVINEEISTCELLEKLAEIRYRIDSGDLDEGGDSRDEL